MAIKRVEALELADILGSLLGSVVDAQAKSARATVAFVEDIGFESSSEAERMRTVRLHYKKKDENGELAEFEVEVPLLAMVNVPSLVVRQAKLSFSYDVISTRTEKGSANSASNNDWSALSKFQAAKLYGFVRRKGTVDSTERRTTAIDLDVTLEQQDMPIGVEHLFDLAELGITEQQIPGES